MKSLKRLEGLHPALVSRAIELAELCEHAGLSFIVTAGLRTHVEQDALYAQGRTTPGKIVTKAKGGESWHNYGLAFDFVPVLEARNSITGKQLADFLLWNDQAAEWNLIGRLGESIGLEWGGSWTKFKDLPHFQLIAGLTITEAKTLSLADVWQAVSQKLPSS